MKKLGNVEIDSNKIVNIGKEVLNVSAGIAAAKYVKMKLKPIYYTSGKFTRLGCNMLSLYFGLIMLSHVDEVNDVIINAIDKNFFKEGE